ncbi:unnamed protein product, partial [Sphacelaria rigidula]
TSHRDRRRVSRCSTAQRELQHTNDEFGKRLVRLTQDEIAHTQWRFQRCRGHWVPTALFLEETNAMAALKLLRPSVQAETKPSSERPADTTAQLQLQHKRQRMSVSVLQHSDTGHVPCDGCSPDFGWAILVLRA